MQRIIKFRGKSKANGEWVYGDYAKGERSHYIIQRSWVEIDPATLGQFTGLHDKNGKEIYEGDIIQLIDSMNDKILTVCEYGIARRPAISIGFEVDIPSFYFKKQSGFKSFPIVKNYAGVHDLDLFEVIGNIHSNPELLQ